MFEGPVLEIDGWGSTGKLDGRGLATQEDKQLWFTSKTDGWGLAVKVDGLGSAAEVKG